MSDDARTEARPTVVDEIERYLRTGETDPALAAWPDCGYLARARLAHDDLRGALLREVRRLAEGASQPAIPEGDLVALTRRKLEPMVRGLFPAAERGAVLAALERSVVFVTSEAIERIILKHDYDKSAWDLANLYLASVGADLLSDDAPSLLGVSEGSTCYVSTDYFTDDDPFADFIVHEAAHVFHNCKRRTLGLRATRTREWLLDIEYRKRETFAYACEAYARVLARSGSRPERRGLADEFARSARFGDARVDAAEIGEIVREAADARNGWKSILARCAPAKEYRSVMTQVRDAVAAHGSQTPNVT